MDEDCSDYPVLIRFIKDALRENTYPNLQWINPDTGTFTLTYPKISIPSSIFPVEDRAVYIQVFKDYHVVSKRQDPFHEVTGRKRLVAAATGSIYIEKVRCDRRGLSLPGFPASYANDDDYDELIIMQFRFLDTYGIRKKQLEKRQKQNGRIKEPKETGGSGRKRSSSDKKMEQTKLECCSSSNESGYDSYPSGGSSPSAKRFAQEAAASGISNTSEMVGISDQSAQSYPVPFHTSVGKLTQFFDTSNGQNPDVHTMGCHPSDFNMGHFSSYSKNEDISYYAVGEPLPTSLDSTLYDDCLLLLDSLPVQQSLSSSAPLRDMELLEMDDSVLESSKFLSISM